MFVISTSTVLRHATLDVIHVCRFSPEEAPLYGWFRHAMLCFSLSFAAMLFTLLYFFFSSHAIAPLRRRSFADMPLFYHAAITLSLSCCHAIVISFVADAATPLFSAFD